MQLDIWKEQSPKQPRSQSLSSSHPLERGGGKRRDPGNEVVPKNGLLTAICGQDMGTFRSNHLHTKPSNFLLGFSVRTQSKIRRFCMEIIGLESAHICATNCNKELIFGQWRVFMMLFPKILSHPIISQIHLFVTSHTLAILSCHLMAYSGCSQLM